VLHGAYSYLLQDEHGQVSLTHSVSAGLDYALVGPEHAWLHDQGRASTCPSRDDEALQAAVRLARTEGIIPALGVGPCRGRGDQAGSAATRKVFLVNLSGRGDKDTDIYRENLPELDHPA
jgi:tryptophan synthase beta chain